jgi:hypothetical protein
MMNQDPERDVIDDFDNEFRYEIEFDEEDVEGCEPLRRLGIDTRVCDSAALHSDSAEMLTWRIVWYERHPEMIEWPEYYKGLPKDQREWDAFSKEWDRMKAMLPGKWHSVPLSRSDALTIIVRMWLPHEIAEHVTCVVS